MKKNIFKISFAVLLSISLVGCGTKQSTENKQSTGNEQSTENKSAEKKTETIEGPGKDFDWNAKVSPVGTKRTYTEQKTGKSITTELSKLQKAQNKLEEKRKSITDKKVLEALKVVDAFYVNQENIDTVVKAAGYNNQKEMYKKLWKDFLMVPKTADERIIFNYQGVNYDMLEYGAMQLKVNSNSYGKAGAYDFDNYKVEGNTVYLELTVPSIDTYQYFVKASYKPNYESFFKPLGEMNQTTDDLSERRFSKIIFYLAAVDFKGDGYVDLQGMDYLVKTKQYLAIQVDDSGKVSIDNDNLLNLLRINMAASNEKNGTKFGATSDKKSNSY